MVVWGGSFGACVWTARGVALNVVFGGPVNACVGASGLGALNVFMGDPVCVCFLCRRSAADTHSHTPTRR